MGPVVLPTLMKSTPLNTSVVRPVNGTHKTAIVSPQQQSSPRVISLKRPYSAITCAKPTEVINEQPNIIKLPQASHIQGLSSFTTEHIKVEEEEMSESGQASVRKRANLDHM